MRFRMDTIIGGTLVAITMALILASVAPTHAQVHSQDGRSRQNPSCFDKYSSFTTNSWNALETCIQETNNSSIWDRLIIRSGCNARWTSNALQAAADYVSCMSIGRLGGN